MDIDILGMIDPGSGEAKGPKEFLTGSFLAFPPSLLDRPDYENGNKGTISPCFSLCFLYRSICRISSVVLPPSVLAGIRDMSGRPLLFQLKNANLPEEESPVTYCGVVEFSSPEENIIVLPTWVPPAEEATERVNKSIDKDDDETSHRTRRGTYCDSLR